MHQTRYRWLGVFFFLIPVLFLSTSFNALAQTEKQKNNNAKPAAESEPVSEENTISPQTKKIDEAAQSIGQGIEKIGSKASSHFGGWINAKIIADITWLKLGVCLFLLFLVVLLQHVLKSIIQVKVRISADEDVASWRGLILESVSKPLYLFIWVYGIYIAFSPLFPHFQTREGTNLVYRVAQKVADLGGTFAILWFVYRLVHVIDVRLKKWISGNESSVDEMLIPIVGKILRIFILFIGGIIIIQNLTGVKIGPLLASLGIGGLAVALAAKDSIANFFGTLTILFDKPFQIGQRIVIDDNDGVVEAVGFRSTRIRLLSGHLVTIPNEKVVNSTLENIGERPYIRWSTNIGITYDTPPDKVEKAVHILEEILKDHEGIHEDYPPRVYFNSFNDWSLNILVTAWYHPPNYWDYQAWLQKTGIEIMRRFETEGIEFAFPTQTTYVADDAKRQLKLEMLNDYNNAGA